MNSFKYLTLRAASKIYRQISTLIRFIIFEAEVKSRGRLFSGGWLDRREDVQDLADVAVLHLQELGQPAAVVGEAHVQHRLKGSLNKTTYSLVHRLTNFNVFGHTDGAARIKLSYHLLSEREKDKVG